MGTKLGFSERQADEVTIVGLSGVVLSSEDAEMLDRALQGPIRAGCTALLLDCRGLTDFDIRGIKPLVRAYVSMTNQEGKLKLLGMPPPLLKLLASINLMSVLECFEEERPALHSFKS
jgi:anti-anti-sigma regulatory factor